MIRPPLVVRPREIWRRPPPDGGRFVSLRAVPAWAAPFVAVPLGTWCVDTRERVAALTYDDGPHPEHTPRILDVLAERGETATFFVLARQVRRHPAIAQRIVADGHELALHGEDHTSLATLGVREAISRIRAARAEVEDVTGSRLHLYRPPYGTITPAQMIALRTTGLRLVIWSSDATDWLHDEEDVLAERAHGGVFPGGIVLLHDDRGDPETAGPADVLPAFDRAAVLTGLLDRLDADGYDLRTVGQLLGSARHVRSIVR